MIQQLGLGCRTAAFRNPFLVLLDEHLVDVDYAPRMPLKLMQRQSFRHRGYCI